MIDFKQIRVLIKREEKLRWALERQMAKATRSTASFSGSGGGRRSDTSKVENGAVAMVPLREQHREIECELKRVRQDLRPKIRRLSDPLARSVMTMRYIHGISVRKIASMLDYSEQHIFDTLNKSERQINQRVQLSETSRKTSEFT